MSFILALDQGTTSSRALLFGPEGTVVALAQREFAQSFPKPGWVEHDAAEIWRLVRETLAEVAGRLGAEGRVARAIVAARPLSTTGELAHVVRRALGYHAGAPKDPATRSFQAIRIHVNAELDELEAALAAAELLLSPGGRLAVVCFHSLEDRIVKQFLKAASGQIAATSRYVPLPSSSAPAAFDAISKAIRAGEAELARNPRSRSATLRHATRTPAPARGNRPDNHKRVA